MSESTHVAIIGAGVAGLRLASLLHERHVPYLLIEAKDRLGGRVHSLTSANDASARFDVGPTWVWPHQSEVLSLIERLGLDTFKQHSAGNLVFQDGQGAVRRDLTFSTMGDALRLRGGMRALTDTLAAQLNPDVILRGDAVRAIRQEGDQTRLTLASGRTITATHVVAALPPRVFAETITQEPPLPQAMIDAMQRVPTWMAGHAKAVAVYDTPFWRQEGLSGDAISHRGPLGELHDASPQDHGMGALFGFFLWPPQLRDQASDKLDALIRDQLSALYGPRAGAPRHLWIVDWARDPHIATAADAQPLRAHPNYRPLPPLDGAWAGRLHVANTETAPRDGGYIEGAVVAAQRLASSLID